jgi:DNA-binding XRE family transcriptional regulator
MNDCVDADLRDGVRPIGVAEHLERGAKAPRADLRMATAKALRAMRVRADLRQADITRATGIHRPIVARIERGRHSSSLETCARYVAACGGTMRELGDAIDAALAAQAVPR